MRYKLRLVCFFLLFFEILNAQNRNSVWCFGDSAGIDFRIPAAPIPISSGMDTRGTCASISDSMGNLLFYVGTSANSGWTPNGEVYNASNQLMLNGNNIYAEGFYDEMLIIPKPGSKLLYYVFSINTYVFDPVGTFYSVVDMSEDSGRGSVIEKNVQIASDSLCGAMTAVKHGNGRDWWVIIKGYSANGDSTFYEYLVTPESIIKRTINIGGNGFTSLGTLTFSKDGSFLAFVSFGGLIETFDFDRCSGDFLNPRVIHPQFLFSNDAFYSGASLSPNKRFLYISDANVISHLFQFDLSASNPWLTKDTLVSVSYSNGGGGQLKLGPNDKIYWTVEWDPGGTFPYPYQANMYSQYNMNLSVIENPDVLGSACNLNLFSFYLGGKRTYWGLPINPDYELPAMAFSSCDSLSNGIIKQEFDNESIQFYPNPFSKVLSIRSVYSIDVLLNVYNGLGEFVYSKKVNGDETIDFGFLPSGNYFIEAISKRSVVRRKLIKMGQ